MSLNVATATIIALGSWCITICQSNASACGHVRNDTPSLPKHSQGLPCPQHCPKRECETQDECVPVSNAYVKAFTTLKTFCMGTLYQACATKISQALSQWAMPAMWENTEGTEAGGHTRGCCADRRPQGCSTCTDHDLPSAQTGGTWPAGPGSSVLQSVLRQ